MRGKKMKAKRLNLADHRVRLKSQPAQAKEKPGLAWAVAFAALALAAVVLFLQR